MVDVWVWSFLLLVLLVGGGSGSGEDEDQIGNKRWEEEGVVSFGSLGVEWEGLLNPLFWTENNERSTSRNYSLWTQADVHLVEWPGNITVPNEKWPLLKWSKGRAKYLVNRCCETYQGIEMRVYAYRYIFLTWGPYRLTMTVTPPLAIPFELLQNATKAQTKTRGRKQLKKRTQVVVADFVFVHDALLLALDPEEEEDLQGEDFGTVLRVFGLELAWAKNSVFAKPLRPLQYAVANGIKSPVNRLVGQYCCAKMAEPGMCPHGETVVAYREHHSDFRIYISADGGVNFKVLLPAVPSSSVFLHSVLPYPDTGNLLVLHGTRKSATLDSYSMSSTSSGTLPLQRSSTPPPTFTGIKGGALQAARIGEEMSLVIWDHCNVWYSLGQGRNMTKALFYVHGFIRHGLSWKEKKKHYIMPEYCRFGKLSSIVFSSTGKIAILDSNNHFHLGVDTKRGGLWPLVPMAIDFSLILEKHKYSLVPHFDQNHHPKIVYPPRYLELPSKGLIGANYSQRLGMRLLPKTVFPSLFITPFYEEYARLPKKFGHFKLSPCQTSSVFVNGSITQKAKQYRLTPSGQLDFSIRFKSRVNTTRPRQLNYEPVDILKFLRMRISLATLEREDDQYWFTYNIKISSRITGLLTSRRIFMLNFFTLRTHRCNFQPSTPVYIRIEDEKNAKPNYEPFASEDELSKGSFVKIERGQTEWGRSYRVRPSACSKDKDPPQGQDQPQFKDKAREQAFEERIKRAVYQGTFPQKHEL